MLTRKQTELLLYINDRLMKDGVSPSFEEMKQALNLQSKSGIHRLITGLEERGFLRRLPHRARALEVIRLPESAARKPPAPSAVPEEQEEEEGGRVVQGAFGKRAAPLKPDEPVQVPLYGRIAAGMPIEAFRDTNNYIDLAPSWLGSTRPHYALEIAGASMKDAGILDGDTVVIEECDNAEPGTIVVALVDNEEVTLKRLRRHKGSIALEAANPAYETRIFGPDRVKIQGRLAGLLRRY